MVHFFRFIKFLYFFFSIFPVLFLLLEAIKDHSLCFWEFVLLSLRRVFRMETAKNRFGNVCCLDEKVEVEILLMMVFSFARKKKDFCE